MFDLAPGYRKSSVPQAGRVAELVAGAWLIFAYQTAVAAPVAFNDNIPSSLVDSVLVGSLLFNVLFALNAGPLRLRNANNEEMILVPVTSILVASAGTCRYFAIRQ